MTIERTPISKLIADVKDGSCGYFELEVRNTPYGRYVVLIDVDDKELASLRFDDLFDAEGNRFEDDVE
jgi:hypothetical protein